MNQRAKTRVRVPTGRPPTISLDTIVERASTVAEAVGLDGLTMNMVADKLGVTPTALYHYVPSKQALIELVVARAFGDIQPPPPDAGPWDQRLRLFERAVREQLRRLPGAGVELFGGDIEHPSVQHLFDIGIAIVADSGADELEVRLAFTTVFAYMMGQLLFDGVYTDGGAVNLGAIQAATGGVTFTSDQLFDYAIEAVIVGLRQRLRRQPTSKTRVPPKRSARTPR
jgi:AcrR family transcriptional regulator